MPQVASSSVIENVSHQPEDGVPAKKAGSRLVEVVVNIPIRRTFSKRFSQAPSDLGDEFEPGLESGAQPELAADEQDGAEAPYQSYHYHLPVELERVVQPGHLVWVPFGRQRVQGVVLGDAETSPVPTKAVIRLARPQPVVSPIQLALARWLAGRYVAPLSEAIRLLLPPGLLQKDEESQTVHAKRELQITWIQDSEPPAARLAAQMRATARSRLLGWFVQNPQAEPTIAELLAQNDVKTRTPLNTLAARGLLVVEEDRVRSALAPAALRATWYAELGVPRFLPLAELLAASDAPVWQSDLYRQVETDLATLRRFAEWGLIRLDEQVRFRDPLAGRTYAQSYAPTLTQEQQAVWERLAEGGFANGGGQYLLHGVTGSGKTEIYLRAIEATLALGRQAIVLAPEIALTPQAIARFGGRFPNQVTVIHSGLSTGERYDVWRAVAQGEFNIVVGPRSALFAPLSRLGLIIVDEEHEPSYKQDAEDWGGAKVFYDARTAARKLAELTGSVLILGSATPSLDAYAAAQRGELTLLEMPRRVMGVHGTGEKDAQFIELPPVEVIDMRQELRVGNRSILSRILQGELQATLAAGEQAILFLNRRGSSTFVMCRACGYVENCNRCDAPLTYHDRAKMLICHHCNRRYPIPTQCPECESNKIKFFGSGTQRVVEVVQEILPEARIVRWDADTASRWDSHEALLGQFSAHEADILVGTQMIAKGLDLPLVTLVGVISADVGLYLPDFRSGERTFQLLTQVAGRAGRSRRQGRVLVQSYTPDHYVVQAAARHDYATFYEREMRYRFEHAYPPVRRMAKLVYWDRNREKAEEQALAMRNRIQARLREFGLGERDTFLIGPAPAFFARVRGFYRWQILLSAPQPELLLRGLEFPFGWRVDVDPVSIL